MPECQSDSGSALKHGMGRPGEGSELRSIERAARTAPAQHYQLSNCGAAAARPLLRQFAHRAN